MARQREVLPDRLETREKFLCAFRVAKAAHTTLAFARWLVIVLRLIVQPGNRFSERVLHVHKRRDLGS